MAVRHAVAMHARMLGDLEVLHPRAFHGLEPRIPDVERVDLATQRCDPVRQVAEDPAAHPVHDGGETRRSG